MGIGRFEINGIIFNLVPASKVVTLMLGFGRIICRFLFVV